MAGGFRYLHDVPTGGLLGADDWVCRPGVDAFRASLFSVLPTLRERFGGFPGRCVRMVLRDGGPRDPAAPGRLSFSDDRVNPAPTGLPEPALALAASPVV